MKKSNFPLVSVCALAAVAVAVWFTGCGGDGDGGGGKTSTPFLNLGTAPIGGAFHPVGDAISETLNNHKPADAVYKSVQAKGTNGSQHNIRQLGDGTLQLAISNSAISYFAVRGEKSWEKKYDIRAVATLAPNVAMFITKADSGIKSISDLKGRKVCVGPPGAGFEMFVGPILAEHGIKWDEFTPRYDTQIGAVDQLTDGTAVAAFIGGAVPTASILQACSTFDVHFIPFDPAVRDTLVEKYPFFSPFTIPQEKYPDLTADFDGFNVGSMHLITLASQSEELIYQLTKTIWENRKEIADKHPAGKALNEKNAARFTGTEFHPGAIKFYKEIGIWKEEAGEGNSEETPSGNTEAESAAGANKAE
jgi:TRAP transporter TAXI family solute receptor